MENAVNCLLKRRLTVVGPFSRNMSHMEKDTSHLKIRCKTDQQGQKNSGKLRLRKRVLYNKWHVGNTISSFLLFSRLFLSSTTSQAL